MEEMFVIDELKSKFGLSFGDIKSGQQLGEAMPAVQKPYPADAKLIDLPKDNFQINNISLFDAIKNRRSRRTFSGEALSLNELSFLLWATQGMRENKSHRLRNVASAGARHPFETYLAIYNVEGLTPGLYRFLPIEHKLICLSVMDDVIEKVKTFVPESNSTYRGIDSSAVTFLWTTIPVRTAWRYPNMAVKLIAQDAGHVCQNLYLAVEAINAGTCAIDAYLQEEADHFLEVDGKNEFTVYLGLVGKVMNDEIN